MTKLMPYDVMGHTLEGAAYCLTCLVPEMMNNTEGVQPIFRDQLDGFADITCETCGKSFN